jgi:plastocyanin
MKRLSGLTVAVGLVLVFHGVAAAQGKITVTREESKPATLEVKAGEDVRWINASGGTAHVSFGGNDAVRFYVGSKDGNRIKFDKPGTYDYTVHVSGTKAHAHTGKVVVK